MARHGRKNRAYRREASLQARVRYGPQERALVGLAQELSANYRQSVKGARGAARATRATVKRVRPEIKGAYRSAGRVRAGAAQDVANVLAQVGPAANAFRVAIAREQAGAKTRLAESRAGALTELSERGVQAEAGAQYAAHQLAQQLRSDTNRIGQQLVGLKGDRGAFAAATIGALADADRKLGVQLHGQRLTYKAAKGRASEQHRHNVKQEGTAKQNADTAAYKATHPASRSRSGKGPTRTQRVAAHDKYDRGVVLAQQLRRGGRDSSGKRVHPASEGEIVQILTSKLGSAVLAKAAAQTAIYHGVGPHTRRRAKHRYGITLPRFPSRSNRAANRAAQTVAGINLRF